MKNLLFAFLLILASNVVHAQKPHDGVSAYSIEFAEWNGKSLGATCTAIIKGDSIQIIHNGNKNLSGRKGDIIEAGITMKHIKTGKWIIAHHKDDKNAKKIGGCSDRPQEIDFERKIFLPC
jgi:hypothetical protein